MKPVTPKPIHPQLIKATIRTRRSYAMVYRHHLRQGRPDAAAECLAECIALTAGLNLVRGCQPHRQLALL